MKFVIFFFISITIVASTPLSRDPTKPLDENEIFNDFTSRHKINFKSKSDLQARKKIFSEKLKKIEEQNKKFDKGEETFREDLNEFSIFTLDEMKAMTLGDIGEPREVGKIAEDHKRSKRDANEPPASWSWYQKGVLRPVRHQGR